MSNRAEMRGADMSPDLFLNRELSWLEFNRRVLGEACDPAVPLAERLKFQGIVASNLDEFFMVRVAGLQQMVAGNVEDSGADGITPREQLNAIYAFVHEMMDRLYANWREIVQPDLVVHAGVSVLRPDQITATQRSALDIRFRKEIWPVLTPLAVDQGHPFPVLRNRSLNLAILLHKERQKVARRKAIVAVVQVPAVLSRLVDIPSESAQKAAFVLLEDVIAMHVGELFPGYRVLRCSPFRVTRNFDLTIDEDDVDDLLKKIQKELRRRERGQAVRLELDIEAPIEIRRFLTEALRLSADETFLVRGPIHLADLMPLYTREELRELKDEPFTSLPTARLRDAPDIFGVVAERDILLHHPYETFDHVVDFVLEAANDPSVLAIKQTLYRTSANSPIVRALIRAAETGKQVTAVVELKARFDEDHNIEWAKVLEEAGVHVVYGLVGLKTHCKLSLVVRRERGELKRYVHMSTGNYNPSTARLYGDISYMTAREAFADDAGALFNLLTGYSSPPSWKRFAVAPVGLHEKVIELINREATFGPKGRIIAKMNSLVDPDVIMALYRASQAGVSIDLLVRGICCLRPGVIGISENIRVVSVVDRFLEHARACYFEAGGKREVFLSSADWMPRNFTRRIEVMFPIEDEALKNRLIDEILVTALGDDAKAHRLRPDGSYERIKGSGKGETSTLRSQQKFIDLAKIQSAIQLDGASGGNDGRPRSKETYRTAGGTQPNLKLLAESAIGRLAS